MIPNALVIAFDKRVTFEPARATSTCTATRATARSPSRSATTPDDDKPGWIVDGQQRSAAIRDARIESFPVCVTAFITDSDESNAPSSSW